MKLIKIYRVLSGSLNDYITLFKEVNVVKMKKLLLILATSCASKNVQIQEELVDTRPTLGLSLEEIEDLPESGEEDEESP